MKIGYQNCPTMRRVSQEKLEDKKPSFIFIAVLRRLSKSHTNYACLQPAYNQRVEQVRLDERNITDGCCTAVCPTIEFTADSENTCKTNFALSQ